MEKIIVFDRDEVSVVVERRTSGLLLVVHIPTELVRPAVEMIDALKRELGPAGSTEGVAEVAGAVVGLFDGARATSAVPTAEVTNAAA